MILHFIKVQTTKDNVQISFDNGTTWNNYPVTENGSHIDDISFSKKDCTDLSKIVIGTTAKHSPFSSESMKKYFDLETKDTYYTTPEEFKSLLSTFKNNTPDNPINIKIKGLNAENIIKIEQAYKETGKQVYININSSDLRFNNDLFNRGYFMGEKYQKYLVGITLPDDLTYIGGNTFNGCTNLKEISIPPLVTDIGRKAFYNCNSLKNVTIPTSVIAIDEYAFETESGRKDGSLNIIFGGSITRWGKVTVESNNNYLKDSNITFTTFTSSIDDVEDFIDNYSRPITLDTPIPLDISGLTTTDALVKLNSILRKKKVYIDLSGCDFSAYKSKFESMDGDDSSGLFDTDVKQYIVSLTIPENVKVIGPYVFSSYENLSAVYFGSGLTTISEGAFINCKSLSETTIGYSVKIIGYNAFFGCSNIKLSCRYTDSFSSFFNNTGVTRDNVYKIEIPDTLTRIDDYEFENCTNLKGITLSESIAYIGEGAFKGCTKLKSISIPSKITKINSNTFENCIALRSINLPSKLGELGDKVFYSCISLENVNWVGEKDNTASSSLTSLGSSVFYHTCIKNIDLSKSKIINLPELAFAENEYINTIVLPKSTLKNIGNKAFYNCTNLEEMSLPSTVENIGDYVFFGTIVSEIDLPANLKSLGIGVFKGSNIEDIVFPNSFTNIGEECFMNSALKTIKFSDSVKFIDSSAFNGCVNLTNVTLPPQLEEIGYYAFANCTNLSKVNIPDTVTGTKKICSISESAFDNLDKITVITMPKYIKVSGCGEGKNGKNNKDIAYIPASLKTIGYRGFKNLRNIGTLRIPSGIEEIGEDAFYSCTELESLTIPRSVKKINAYAFNSCSKLKNIMYEGSEQEWKELTVGWYPEPVYADDGTQLLDGNSQPLSLPKKKLYVKDGNENIFNSDDHPITMFFNSDLNSIGTYFDQDNNTYNFSRPKSYGNYKFMIDDTKYPDTDGRKGEIQIVEFKDIEEIHTLDTTVYAFGKGAFENCPNLSITIRYTPLLANYFKDSGITKSTGLEIFVPKETTEFPDEIFKGYVGLTKMVFEEGMQLERVGDYAFYGCKNLESISVPKSITYIGAHAFQDCRGLVSIEMNDATTVIRESTFEGCSNLVSINYPETLESIEDRAFYGCSSLVYVEFFDALTNIGANSFAKCGNLRVTCRFNESYSDGSSNWRDKSKYIGYTGISTKNVYKLYISDKLTEIPNDEFVNEHNPLKGERDQYENLHEVIIPNTITRIGERAFAQCNNLEVVTFLEGSKLKVIDETAFLDCTSIKNFTIPNTVTTLGKESFCGCTSLEEISLPEKTIKLADGVFAGCTSLSKAHLPSKITKIPKNFFLSCVSLKDVNIPKDVDTFENACFMGCSSLTDFEIRNNVVSVEFETFHYCPNIRLLVHYNSMWDYIYSQNGFNQSQVYHIHVDNKPTSIPDYKFEKFTSIIDVTFDCVGTSVIENIGVGSFRGCRNLTTIVPPDSCKFIQDWAFAETNVGTFKFPPKVTRLSGDLFNSCKNLSSVTFDCSPTELCENTFKNCSSLKSIKLPDSLKTLGKGSFWGCSSLPSINIPSSSKRVEDNMFHECSKLSTIIMGSNVEELGNGAFFGCTSLTTFDTSKTSIYEIDNSCFENCSKLRTVKLANKVTELGSRAFYNCPCLTELTMSSGLTEIRFGTFEKCISLTSFDIPANIEVIEGNVFTNCSSLVLSSTNNNHFEVIWNGKGIITKDGKTLLACLDYKSKTLEIPNTIEKVGNGVFKNCKNLTSISFPDSVKYIDEYACQDCTSLTILNFTKNVRRIGKGAFENCSNLGCVENTGIFYQGSQLHWDNLVINPDGNTYVDNPIRLYLV